LEDVNDVRHRDKELSAIAEGFCEQSDVGSSRVALKRIANDDTRAGLQVCIVRALLKLQRLRDARFEADSIVPVSSRAEACKLILDALAAAKSGRGTAAVAAPEK
jgi:hypothetical protein